MSIRIELNKFLYSILSYDYNVFLLGITSMHVQPKPQSFYSIIYYDYSHYVQLQIFIDAYKEHDNKFLLPSNVIS